MDHADTLVEQGIALARAGQKEQAYAVLRRALFNTGDDATLRIWLGATAPTLAEALTHLERAVALEPNNPQAQAGVQWVHQQMAAAPAPTPAPTAPPPPETPRGSGEARPPLTPTPRTAPAGYAAPGLPPIESEFEDGGFRTGPSGYAGQGMPRMAARPLETPGPATPGPGEVLACANCGMRATPGDRFCLRCGRPLPATTLPVPGPPGEGIALAGSPEPSAAPLGLTIAPQPRSLSSRPLVTDEPAPTPAPPPLEMEMGPPQTVLAPKRPKAARQAGSGAPGRPLMAWLIGLAVLVLLALVGVYVFAIRPGQQSSADATAVAMAASANATATVATTATQGAIAQATAGRQATVAAAPTVTAQARAERYFAQIATIVQQVTAQDVDIEHTMEGVQNGTLGYDVAATQFKTFVDDSSSVKSQLAQLAVPPEQRHHHQQMTEALLARGQGVVAGQQFVEDLAGVAYAIYKAEQANKDLQLAHTACQQTKARADCNQEITAQRTYDDASSAAERARSYATQSLQDYNRAWQQYKQLMPSGPSGGTQQ